MNGGGGRDRQSISRLLAALASIYVEMARMTLDDRKGTHKMRKSDCALNKFVFEIVGQED